MSTPPDPVEPIQPDDHDPDHAPALAPGPDPGHDHDHDPRVVHVSELVDLDATGPSHRPPTPAELRAALPRGWVLEPDAEHARRDARLFFREGWILLVGLLVFGGVSLALFWQTFPSGWRGVMRLAALIAVVLLAGGVVAPMITRALNRGVGPKRGP